MVSRPICTILYSLSIKSCGFLHKCVSLGLPSSGDTVGVTTVVVRYAEKRHSLVQLTG